MSFVNRIRKIQTLSVVVAGKVFLLQREVKRMHTVIKGTKTVAEFKTVKEKMEKLAAECYSRHKTNT